MNRRMAKRSKQKSETPSSTAFNANSTSEEPILSAGALNKLTQRIQTNFDKAKVQGKGRNVDSTKGNSIANGNKDKKGKIEMEKLVVRKPGKPARLKKPDEKENRRDRSTEDAKHIRGKKRARDGELKPQQSTGAPKSSPRRPNHTVGDVLPKKPVKKGKIDKEALLKEIIELGGTQEDLDLVNDIESDPEVEETEFNNSSKAEKGLKNELVGFMKEIGLEGSKFHAVADEDEDEEWQVENEGRGGGGERGWEEEEDIEDQEEEDEETANRAPVTTFAAPFDSKLHGSKLVILLIYPVVMLGAFSSGANLLSSSLLVLTGTALNFQLPQLRALSQHQQRLGPSTPAPNSSYKQKTPFIQLRTLQNPLTVNS